jgi:hypothetical protein
VFCNLVSPETLKKAQMKEMKSERFGERQSCYKLPLTRPFCCLSRTTLPQYRSPLLLRQCSSMIWIFCSVKRMLMWLVGHSFSHPTPNTQANSKGPNPYNILTTSHTTCAKKESSSVQVSKCFMGKNISKRKKKKKKITASPYKMEVEYCEL